MTFSVTWLNKQGQSRTEHIVADTSFIAVQTAQLIDNVARVQRIVRVTTPAS